MTKNNNKSEWLFMRDIVDGKMILGRSTYYSVRRIVLDDQKGKNILKPIITGKGKLTKYLFKRENVAKFIHAVEAGKVRL